MHEHVLPSDMGYFPEPTTIGDLPEDGYELLLAEEIREYLKLDDDTLAGYGLRRTILLAQLDELTT